MFNINLQSRQPISEQLYAKINQLISLGVLKPGEQLPTVRSLACKIGINPNTAAKAYQMLEHDGIIYTVVGKGSFICDDVDLANQKRQVILSQLAELIQKACSCGVTIEQIRNVLNENYINHAEGGQ